jgi:hypothetical protein
VHIEVLLTVRSTFRLAFITIYEFHCSQIVKSFLQNLTSKTRRCCVAMPSSSSSASHQESIEVLTAKWQSMPLSELDAQLQVLQNRAKNLNATMHGARNSGCVSRTDHYQNWLEACERREACRAVMKARAPPKVQKELKLSTTKRPADTTEQTEESKRTNSVKGVTSDLEQELNTLRLEKMQKELAELKAARDASVLSEAEAKQQAQQNQLKTLQQQLEDEIKKKNAALKLCNQYRQAVRGAKIVNDRLTASNEKLHKTIVDAGTDNAKVVAELKGRIGCLEEQVKAGSTSNKKLSQDNEHLQQELKIGFSKLGMLETDNVAYKLKLASMEKVVEDLRSENLELTDAVRSFQELDSE